MSSKKQANILSFFGKTSKKNEHVAVQASPAATSAGDDEFSSPAVVLPSTKLVVRTYSKKRKDQSLVVPTTCTSASPASPFKATVEDLDMPLPVSITHSQKRKVDEFGGSDEEEFDIPKKHKTSTNNNNNNNSSNKSKKLFQDSKEDNKLEQTYLDLGQKNFGLVECEECKLVYNPGKPEDDQLHRKVHKQHANKTIDFPGWKNENVVKRYGDSYRIIIIDSQTAPPQHLKKVSQIREVMDRELGYVESKDKGKREGEKVFVLVHSKKVIGCTIAESISEGFPVILNKSRKKTKGNSTSDVGAQESPASSQSDTPEPSSSCSPPSPSQNDNSSNNNDSSSQSSQSSNNKTNANNNNNNSNNKNSSKNTRKKQHISNNSSECVNESESESGMSASEDIVVCSKTAQPAVCGISRIWMHRAHRRQGHASKLLDAVRNHFVYGFMIPLDQLAFTQPTPDGQRFFPTYTGMSQFLVYTPSFSKT